MTLAASPHLASVLFLRTRKRERPCSLKESAEGTYRTKHAKAARLNYTTTHRHRDTNMNKDRPVSKLKLGHARGSHCAPNRLEQHGVARLRCLGAPARFTLHARNEARKTYE